MQGRQTESLALMRESVALAPADPRLHSKLIALMAYVEGTDTASLRAEQRLWDRAHGLPHPPAPHQPRLKKTGKLRIGYLGDDLGFGAIGRVVGGMIRAADRDAFEVFCYATTRTWDDASMRLALDVDAWRITDRLDDGALAEAIRGDAIDVLVDLSSHVGGNRLPVLARRPAPVQLSGWGFLPGAGLSGIQGLFTDRTVIPVVERENFCEHLFDLPCALGLQPWPVSPPEGPPPSANAAVTFGCLNRIEKISDSVCAAWADVLRAVEGSRLVLMDQAFADESMRVMVTERFERRGVAPERLSLLTRRPIQEYLAVYQQIDIALDPWPHSGGLTTLDALWMGVPVVTMPGRHALARTSASILRTIGVAELIASDRPEYVRCAIDLAHRPQRRAELRSTLRTQLRHSAICDAAGYARAVEDAYRDAWRRWGPRA